MCYSTEPRERGYGIGYGFLSFAKNISKNLSNKYGQKIVDSFTIIPENNQGINKF